MDIYRDVLETIARVYGGVAPIVFGDVTLVLGHAGILSSIVGGGDCRQYNVCISDSHGTNAKKVKNTVCVVVAARGHIARVVYGLFVTGDAFLRVSIDCCFIWTYICDGSQHTIRYKGRRNALGSARVDALLEVPPELPRKYISTISYVVVVPTS